MFPEVGHTVGCLGSVKRLSQAFRVIEICLDHLCAEFSEVPAFFIAGRARQRARAKPAFLVLQDCSNQAAALGAASMAGIPPMLGFLAKESAYEALVHAEGAYVEMEKIPDEAFRYCFSRSAQACGKRLNLQPSPNSEWLLRYSPRVPFSPGAVPPDVRD